MHIIRTIIDCANEWVEAPQTAYEMAFSSYNEKPRHRRATVLRAQASCWESISIMLYAGTVVRGGLLEHRWMVITRLQRPSSNTTATTSTAVFPVFQSAERSINQSQTRENRFLAIVESTRRSRQLVIALLINGSVKTKRRKEFCHNKKRKPTRTPSSMILNRTTTANRRKTRSQSHWRMKTPTYLFRWALGISTTQDQKSWSGSLCKSWRGTGKTFGPSSERS